MRDTPRTNAAINNCWIVEGTTAAEFVRQLERDKDELVGELAAAQRRSLCNVCGGTGRPTSGRDCICGGSGQMAHEVVGLRTELRLAQQRIAELEQQSEDNYTQGRKRGIREALDQVRRLEDCEDCRHGLQNAMKAIQAMLDAAVPKEQVADLVQFWEDQSE